MTSNRSGSGLANARSSGFPLVWVAALAAIAVLLRLFFLIYTHRSWEDALTVVVESENAASGLGLTFGGARVHAFTSPLSVLVPFVGDLFHVGFGITFIKIVSAFVSAAAVIFGALTARDLGFSKPLIVLVAGYLAFEHHQILWGMAGMETEMVVAILLFSIWSLLNPAPVRTGVAMGLCMYARPDLAMWLCIAGVFLLLDARRQRSYRALATMTATVAVLYVPWIIFTTAYYGSPIPNSLMAKNVGYPIWTKYFSFGWTFMVRAKTVFMDALAPLGPSFGGNGTGFIRFRGGYLIEEVMLAMLLAGLFIALLRRDFRALPVFAFIAVYGAYYTFLVPHVFGWYCVPFSAVSVIGCVYGLNALLDMAPEGWRAGGGVLATAAYLGAIAMVLPTTFRGEHNVQTYVEDRGRKQIGLYLHQAAGPNDTVGCEPLGYISYYSRKVIFDFPGLGNPRVVAFLKANPDKRSMDAVLEHFRPTFIVLRSYEYANYSALPADAWLNHDYTMVRDFQVPPEDAAKLLFPKRNLDLHFVVLKKI